MRLMEIGVGKICRVARHERQIARVGKLDQRIFGRCFHRVIAPRQLDIKPVWKQRLQPVCIRFGMVGLASCKEPRQTAFARPGQGNQAVRVTIKIGERDMRIQLERTFQMRAADEMAKIVPAGFVLREQREMVDRLLAAEILAPRDAQKRADNRLDADLETGLRESNAAIQPVAVADGNRGKAAFLRELGDLLGIDRAFEHRIAGENTQGNEGGIGHVPKVGAQAVRASCAGRLSPDLSTGSGAMRAFRPV